MLSLHEGISDHKLVLITCNVVSSMAASKRPVVYVHNFKNADDVDILDYLESSLSSFDDAKDVDDLWYRFKDIINHCLERFVPKTEKTYL